MIEYKMRNRLALSLIKKYLPNGAVPTDADLACVTQRQLGHGVGNVIAVDGTKCKHGFTRAIVRFPVHMTDRFSRPKTQSGMLRLTCPHLTKEIDSLESAGGIELINEELKSSEDMKSNYRCTNRTWMSMRKESVSSEEVQQVEERMGSEAAKHFFESGIIGVSQAKTDDAKCLHAHVADFILRGNNKIGERALEMLVKDRNVDIGGCADCWHQCDSTKTKNEAVWWYVPKKNKIGLRRNKHAIRKDISTALLPT